MLGCMNENQILAANCFDGEAQSDWYVAVDVVDGDCRLGRLDCDPHGVFYDAYCFVIHHVADLDDVQVVVAAADLREHYYCNVEDACDFDDAGIHGVIVADNIEIVAAAAEVAEVAVKDCHSYFSEMGFLHDIVFLRLVQKNPMSSSRLYSAHGLVRFAVQAHVHMNLCSCCHARSGDSVSYQSHP